MRRDEAEEGTPAQLPFPTTINDDSDPDKQLLRSYRLKRSKQGRRFPPRTVGLWFQEGVMELNGRSRQMQAGRDSSLLFESRLRVVEDEPPATSTLTNAYR